MRDATDALITWQLASRPGVLPPYDEPLLRRELDSVSRVVSGAAPRAQAGAAQRCDRACSRCWSQSKLAQPAVYVHRDYMPRNLMLCEPNPGMLDFQDAVYGPITYDVVSLVRDAFISWDEERVLDWMVRYWEKARRRGLPVAADFGDFYRDFEWMGLQRHLKVLGIFARISYRDGKAVPRGHAALPRLRARRRPALHALAPLARLLDELHAHEGDDPRRRARRAHAPAHRPRAQVAARGRRQAADRLAAGAARRGPASATS